MRLRGHRLAEERSLELHREIARRLLVDPRVLAAARERVGQWCSTGSVAPHYAQGWRQLLAEPPEEIVRRITDPSEEARALRQVTPFAGLIAPRERWRIWREVAAREAEP
ncbi:MAG: hypothetical protein HYY25_13225 [Candidatus Wallbacteria bacterium]|nr:hypothetical protein [Candidatus Wallbacteria bacterium]